LPEVRCIIDVYRDPWQFKHDARLLRCLCGGDVGLETVIAKA
jgi:hypothetical protein